MEESIGEVSNHEASKCHKELTDKLDLLEIGNNFMGASNHKQHTLGEFIPTDQV